MKKLTLESALEIRPGDRIFFTPGAELNSSGLVPGNYYEVEMVQLSRISIDSRGVSYENFRTKEDFANRLKEKPVDAVFYLIKDVGGLYTYTMFSL